MIHNIFKRISFSVFACLLFVSGLAFTPSDNFKILRLKGRVTLNSEKLQVGNEYPIEDIINLSITSDDESGFVVLCYNNCSKNKIVLEKTINLLDAEEKRTLIETTSFKSRGSEMSAFPELVNYFEDKPLLILADCYLEVPQVVLDSPQSGSFLDLYYLDNNDERIYEIPYENECFFLKRSMFGDEKENDVVKGPIELTIVDPKGAKEHTISEDFYAVTIAMDELNAYCDELSAIGADKLSMTEGIYDWLKLTYPNYYIDVNFVRQYIDNK